MKVLLVEDYHEQQKVYLINENYMCEVSYTFDEATEKAVIYF